MRQKITADTIIISAFSLILQGLSIALNIAVTRQLGESAVGVLSLVSQFFVFAITLSGGNIFVISSRFISEEIGRKGNVEKIVLYCLISGLTLSFIFSGMIFALSSHIIDEFMEGKGSIAAIRIMALSLPLATTGSCIKGYFHARRIVLIPCISEFTEFFVKGASLLSMIILFAKNGKADIFTCSAVSLMLGEAVSCIMLCVFYVKERLPKAEVPPKISFGEFLKLSAPITLGAYIFVLLSATNEALVPITLKSFSGSAETALSQYGIFEGIIMPVIFFPSVLLQSLSVILVPEIARENKGFCPLNVRKVSKRAISQAFSTAFISAMFIFSFGGEIGALLSESPLASKTLTIICPVIPFIYIEIVTESILKGLGRQKFCIINSAAEYLIRISCVVVFVRFIGFYGVIVSYFASNIICNTIRIIAVHKLTGLRFDFVGNILVPLFSAAAATKLSSMLYEVMKNGSAITLIISGAFSLLCFILLNEVLQRFCKEKEQETVKG